MMLVDAGDCYIVCAGVLALDEEGYNQVRRGGGEGVEGVTGMGRDACKCSGVLESSEIPER